MTGLLPVFVRAKDKEVFDLPHCSTHDGLDTGVARGLEFAETGNLPPRRVGPGIHYEKLLLASGNLRQK